MSEDELHELLGLRATIHFAMRSTHAFRRDLRLLAAVAPEHRFDPALPPAFLMVWEVERAVAEPVAIEVEVRRDPKQAVLRARLTGTGTELAEGPPRIAARPREGPWRESRDGALTLDAEDAEEVRYWAEVTGPGGVVLAREGSPEAPRIAPPLPTAVDADADASLGRDARTAWIVAGSAGAVAIGLAIALAVVGGGDGEHSTVVGPPAFSMP